MYDEIFTHKETRRVLFSPNLGININKIKSEGT